MEICGFKPQQYSFIYENGEVLCKSWTLNNILGPLKEGTEDTHIAFDSPKGFFVVSDGTEIFYTRNGEYTPDSDGNLKNLAGYFLMGWKL